MAEEKVKPFVSLILPAYNEEAIIEKSIEIILTYLKSLEDRYKWEILIINDGSNDRTGTIAESLSRMNSMIRVIHHPVNLNLGRALQTGFQNAFGDIMVVLDMDLSYAPDHIEKLVSKQVETNADVVIASPYMKNGKVTNVPFFRAFMSRVVNRFMQFAAQEKFHTFTGMVRAYKASFIRTLNLKTKDYEINPEIIYKALILRAKIVEIPAHLDWSFQNGVGKKRTSAMKVTRGFFSGLMSGFIFRPYLFYFTFGVFLLIIALYVIFWIFINTFRVMHDLTLDPQFLDDKFSMAIGMVYKARPHAFFVGGITLILAIQIISLGLLSLQKKRYFEEQFHISSSILKLLRSDKM